MSEEKIRFIFALSAEGTRLYQEGALSLSSGGLRREDGTIYEMATPICFNPESDIKTNKESNEEDYLLYLRNRMSQIDLNTQVLNEVREIAWMNYLVGCKTYEITYQGFQRVIAQLDTITSQLDRIEMRMYQKENDDIIEKMNKYKNKLKSIAGFMETKNFSATSSFFDVVSTLDEIDAFLDRLHKEVINGIENGQIAFGSIIFLIGPYSYVVRKFSSLYYYENGEFPPNYEKWVKTVRDIIRDACIKRKILYYIRVNSECSLEEVYHAKDQAWNMLRGYIQQMTFERLFVNKHTKDEYLSINEQIQKKYDKKDYQIINGHLCVEL